MSEYASGYNNHEQQGELLTERETLESYTPFQLAEIKTKMLEEISDRERIVNIINTMIDVHEI